MSQIIDARARPPVAAFAHDRTYANLARTTADLEARGWQVSDSIRTASLDGYLAESAAAGITRAGLPARVPNPWWGGRGNDPVFGACAEHDGYFYPYAAVHPFDPAPGDSVSELAGRGARGVVVEPGIADEPAYLDDARIDPLYDVCQSVGMPVLLMGGGETGPDLSYSDPLRFERVAIRFPRLTLVNVHGGWPFVQDALGVAYRRKNVWMLPDVYFPGLPGEADYVLAMRTFLQDRFLFATGYPFCPVQACVDRFTAFGLSADVTAKVMHDNAARLFGPG